ncbi:hypothetical protein GUJ93_ZPchr0011g28527 [Zizania palustris]|uniref:Uncharacterized protein n=1 Tax=Zizania palustris TaxID=103762 RepID=A0A8J5WLU4_ZIZPA|nr:hypothetical protein GUJ93_ZPchr0011g28527 [Zizania palustris]
MAATATDFPVIFVVVLCLLHGAEAQVCRKGSEVAVAVTKTGRSVGGQPEYRVDFTTACPCPVVGVRLTCDGLDGSAEPLDPSTVEVVGDGVCALKLPVVPGKTVSFKYALEAPINLRVISGGVKCTTVAN